MDEWFRSDAGCREYIRRLLGRMVSPGIGTKISPTTYDMLIKPDTQG